MAVDPLGRDPSFSVSLFLQDARMRDSISMGSPDTPLEDKMVTICYGTDMVNLSFINFAANSRDVAKVPQSHVIFIWLADKYVTVAWFLQEWCQLLFQFATNLLASNASPMTFLLKCYTKLVTIVNTDGKIPVRKWVHTFCGLHFGEWDYKWVLSFSSRCQSVHCLDSKTYLFFWELHLNWAYHCDGIQIHPRDIKGLILHYVYLMFVGF